MTTETMDVVVAPDETAERIREYVRTTPDLVYDRYQDGGATLQSACYPLSEAYFHAKGGTDSGLDIHCLSWADVDDDYEGTHWFLSDDTRWIDLSLSDPSDGEQIPWRTARRRAFITGYEPSARAQRILGAITQ